MQEIPEFHRRCLFVCLRGSGTLVTGRGVDENHLQPGGLSGSLELRQVAVVEPGRLHGPEAGGRGGVDPLAEVWQLGEEPGDVGAEPERSHAGPSWT